jgi:hypothetical protein
MICMVVKLVWTDCPSLDPKRRHDFVIKEISRKGPDSGYAAVEIKPLTKTGY